VGYRYGVSQMKKMIAAVATAGAMALALGAATSAEAALVLVSPCNVSDISPTAEACAGWYDGNLLNNPGIADQQAALATLGFVWDGNWAVVDATKVGPTGGNAYDFAGTLDGTAFIGVHKGKGGRTGFEGTAFFKVSGTGIDQFILNLPGGSSAVIYVPNGGGVIPEPATWAMMILGFGGVGTALRTARRRKELAI